MNAYINNLSKENMLLDNVMIANSFFSRLKGLLGKSSLNHGEGILIKPCNSIHTMGMKFPIDVAFLDDSYTVIFIMEEVGRGKFSPIVKYSKYVIEARAGTFKAKGLELGDVIEVVESSS